MPTPTAPVQSIFKNGTAGAGLATQTFPVQNTLGNAIVVIAMTLAGSGRTFTCSDTQLNSYGAAKVTISDTLNNTTMSLFVANNVAGGVNTVTVSSNTGTDQVVMCQVEVGGVLSAAFDNAAGQHQTTPGTGANAITSGNATTTNLSFVLGFTMYSALVGAPNNTSGTGFTSVQQPNIAVQGWSGLGLGNLPARLEWQANVPAGTVAATFSDTRGANASYNTVMVALDIQPPAIGFLGAASTVSTAGLIAASWNTVSLSGIVPLSASGAVLLLSATAGHAINGLGLRATGSGDTWAQDVNDGCPGSSQQYRHVGLGTGANALKFDCWPQTGVNFAGTTIQVVGFYGQGVVFLLAAKQLPAATVGVYNTYNAYSNGIPTGALGVLLAFNKTTSQSFGIRQGGSSDDFSTMNTGFTTAGDCVVGLDGLGNFQLKTNQTALTPFIIGYFTSASGFLWNLNAINRTPGVAGSAQALMQQANAIGYYYQVGNGVGYIIAANGTSGLVSELNTGGSIGQAASGIPPTANLATLTNASVLELGYFSTAPQQLPFPFAQPTFFVNDNILVS